MTKAELIRRLREDYRNAQGEQAVTIAQAIQNLIAAGTLTDADLRAAFGTTVAQWAQVKARMKALIDARAVVRAARGE